MDRRVIISPSIMCVNPWDYPAHVEAFKQAGVDLIHFDVMDGHFVPNVMLGTRDYAALKSITDIPLDLHLMCEEPERILGYFPVTAGDWVSFHPETSRCPYRTLSHIRSLGCKAGIALSPGTPVEVIREFKSVLDFILVMAVEPGFAGQKMVPDHLDKLRAIHKIVEECKLDVDILVDGNTSSANSRAMLEAGATGFVAGTSSMLRNGPESFIPNYNLYLKEIMEPAQ